MEELNFIVLGSGSSIPTANHNHSGYWLQYEGTVILLDCGEGIQRQIRKAKLSPTNIDRIFITHWHTDHFAGLLGLLETLKMEERTKKLQIYGPQASQYIAALSKIVWNEAGFDIEAVDIDYSKKEKINLWQTKKFKVSAAVVNHSVPAVAYCFQEHDRWNIDLEKAAQMGLKEGPRIGKLKKEKEIIHQNKKIKLQQIADLKTGRKIVYSGDTGPSKGLRKLAQQAKLLVHEATFLEKQRKGHSTAQQAAQLAALADVKKLLLTHYSRRFKEPNVLIKEAKKYFQPVELAQDLNEYNL